MVPMLLQTLGLVFLLCMTTDSDKLECGTQKYMMRYKNYLFIFFFICWAAWWFLETWWPPPTGKAASPEGGTLRIAEAAEGGCRTCPVGSEWKWERCPVGNHEKKPSFWVGEAVAWWEMKKMLPKWMLRISSFDGELEVMLVSCIRCLVKEKTLIWSWFSCSSWLWHL